MPARKVTRSIHEGARDLARSIATTDANLVSRRQRKKVEMLLALLKRILKLDRLRLRGPDVTPIFHPAATRDRPVLTRTVHRIRRASSEGRVASPSAGVVDSKSVKTPLTHCRAGLR